MDTKEKIKANVIRFTTANVTCTLSDDSNYPQYIFTHKNFPFVCSVGHSTVEGNKTAHIFMSNESQMAIRKQFGLSYELFTSAKNYAGSYVKYKMENKPVQPNDAKLSTIEGSRLISFRKFHE